ncbi:MAG: energy transducer TonB [Firmicutes bacterium]|nr:energy transducer TonB [Bacillota bacterium]
MKNTTEFLALSFLLHLFLPFIFIIMTDYKIPEKKEEQYTITSIIIEKQENNAEEWFKKDIPEISHKIELKPEIKKTTTLIMPSKQNLLRKTGARPSASGRKSFRHSSSAQPSGAAHKTENTPSSGSFQPPPGGAIEKSEPINHSQSETSASETKLHTNPVSEKPASEIHTPKPATPVKTAENIEFPKIPDAKKETGSEHASGNSGSGSGVIPSENSNKHNGNSGNGSTQAGSGEKSSGSGSSNHPGKNNGNENGAGSGAANGNNHNSGNSGDLPNGKNAPDVYIEAGGSIDPPYPEEAKERGEAGTVVVEVEITTSGRAGNISITSSSGYPSLDNAVTSAIRSTSFRPATKNGKPSSSRKRFVINFNLED